MTGAGGFGGYAPFKQEVTVLDLRERVPQSEDLVELVLQGLSPEKAVTRALEGFGGSPIADNAVELYLHSPDPGALFQEVRSRAGGSIRVEAREGKVYVKTEEPAVLQRLVQDLQGSGITFQVSEVTSQ